MLQQREKSEGGDKRWYNPDRDLAYCWQKLMQSAADGLEETRWEDFFGDYLRHVGLTEAQIGDAIVVYVNAIKLFPDPEIKSPREALQKAGWFDLPKAAQAVICLKLGQVATCAFFNAIRDVTLEGQPPQLDVERITQSANNAQDNLGRKTWAPKWLKNLIRKIFL